MASCPTRRCCCHYLSAQQHRVRRQRACGGGWPLRGRGLGRERGPVRQQGDKWRSTGTSLLLGRRGSADTRVTEVPKSWSAARHAAGLGWAEGHTLPPCLDVTLGTGSGGRGREGGSGRAEPRAAGCGERERGTSHAACGDPPPARQRQRSPLSAQLWGSALAGMGTNPNEQRSCQVAVPGCSRCQGVGSHT